MGRRARQKPRIAYGPLLVAFFAGVAANALAASIIEYLIRGN